jgi:ribA/ribD-fused uncharacterized protein
MKYSRAWLEAKYNQGEALTYIFFWGHTAKKSDDVGPYVFSQWFYAPFTVGGITYKTAEHWMMANKALLFGNKALAVQIIETDKPAFVKELGRKIEDFDEETWNQNKFEIVVQGNLAKFQQHEKLQSFLLNTGNKVLVEASPVDIVWGIGLSKDEPAIENPQTWKGENLLGFAIMQARDIIRSLS